MNRDLEQKYQDQIKNMQTDQEHERENLLSHSNKQQVKLENEIEKLKEDESKLKEKLLKTQKVNIFPKH